jgi:hypothetical protein
MGGGANSASIGLRDEREPPVRFISIRTETVCHVVCPEIHQIFDRPNGAEPSRHQPQIGHLARRPVPDSEVTASGNVLIFMPLIFHPLADRLTVMLRHFCINRHASRPAG